MAPGEGGTGIHGGQDGCAEALVARRPFEGCHGLPETVGRPLIVALGLVDSAKIDVCHRVHDDIPTGLVEIMVTAAR